MHYWPSLAANHQQGFSQVAQCHCQLLASSGCAAHALPMLHAAAALTPQAPAACCCCQWLLLFYVTKAAQLLLLLLLVHPKPQWVPDF
jgi:hypothetical protein